MRRILIVSPNFPPKSTPDLHRVRGSLRYYSRFGWTPTVLCISPEFCEGLDDPALTECLPSDVCVVRIKAWDEGACRRFGFGQLAYRSLLPLYRAGCRLLKRQQFDVVFFSTTVFLAFTLGPLWKRRFGCRVVYDFQDPWYEERSVYSPDTVPGKWWKYRLNRWLARHLERYALRDADHVIAVSESYVETLSRRHSELGRSAFTVLPFGGSADDYDFVRDQRITQEVFQPDGRALHWVYAGRGGHDMAPVLAALFRVVAEQKRRHPQWAARLRLHFIGTNYAPAERSKKLVEPVAEAAGIADMVEEIVERVPFFQALAAYDACDAILLIGSVRSDYTASKLIPCVLSKKPILALFHRQSLISQIAGQFSNVFLAAFDQTPDEPEFRAQVEEGIAWLAAPTFDAATIDAEVKPWSAEELTRRQCAIFDQLVYSSLEAGV